MDRIDVLGDSNVRFESFTKELLAESSDTELQKIVKNAATELNSPIALVSLVLDHVQFFKAHIGLPPVLAAAQGTHRDVSFCQFVVRDGETFEVNDASNDHRIPQHVVKEYNIQAYLGVPIKVNETVMGSLCVLDTKKRSFSKEEHFSLKKLANLVNLRLEEITKTRRHTRLDLTETTLIPAIGELSDSLKSVQKFIALGYSARKSIQTFLNHSNHLYATKSQYSDAIQLAYEAACASNNENEDILLEMEFAINDGIDCIKALEQLVVNIESTHISTLITAAQDLSRHSTKLIGGFPLPDFKSDRIVYTQGKLALAIITNCLQIISSELGKANSQNGIVLNIDESDDFVELKFSTNDLTEQSWKKVNKKIEQLITSELPTLTIDSRAAGLILNFKTMDIAAGNKS
jgi:hypothetical protein